MRKDLREKILAYNRAAAEKSDKAADLDAIISAFDMLPPGQLKKVLLNDDLIAVLKKYGVDLD